ncbi:MAG: hypothetical protein JSS27_03470 [Planctomycetes bacterium]|nr:hypothetical protein [Planctomycetota bacterium]
MQLAELKKRLIPKLTVRASRGEEALVVDQRSDETPAECVTRKLSSLLNRRLDDGSISRYRSR